MGAKSISHEVAFATSVKVVRVFAPLIREEEQAEAVREVYAVVKDALLAFAERMEREQRRLCKPPLAVEPATEGG